MSTSPETQQLSEKYSTKTRRAKFTSKLQEKTPSFVHSLKASYVTESLKGWVDQDQTQKQAD